MSGVYLAGDGAGILGADAAEWAGERTALTLLQDLGHVIDTRRAVALDAQLSRSAEFRSSLEHAFPFPKTWGRDAPDELVICRCENIRAGELRQCVKETNAYELGRLKALTPCGHGALPRPYVRRGSG